MTDNDLTTSDVLTDPSKNLCNLLNYTDGNYDEEEDDPMALQDNLYYTETEFTDLMILGGYCTDNNLTIISLNVANLLSKLSSLRQFLNRFKENKPDIIIIVETHISNILNGGYDQESLRHLLEGYIFFHEGRKGKRGGGVGIFVSNALNSEPRVCEAREKGVEFAVEKFVIVKIPDCIKVNQNRTKDLIVMAIYRLIAGISIFSWANLNLCWEPLTGPVMN